MDDTESTTQEKPMAAMTLPLATRAGILGVEDSNTSHVNVPEWGMRVYVRGLSAGERDVWERLTTGRLSEEESKRHFRGVKLGPNHSRALVVFYGALNGVDGADGRMFSDSADIHALARKQSAAVSRIAEAIIELSAIEEEDIEELEGEYDKNPSREGSTSLRKSSKSGTSRTGGS